MAQGVSPSGRLGRSFAGITASFMADLRAISVAPETLQDKAPDFETYTGMRTVAVARVTAIIGSLLMLSLLPTDLFVYRDDPALKHIVIGTRLLLVVLFLGFRQFMGPWAARHPTGVLLWGATLLLSVAFYVTGMARDPATPFVFNVMFVSFVTVGFFMKLRLRILVTLYACMVSMAAYYLPHPQHFEYRYVGAVWIFVFASMVAGVLIGHMLYRLEEGNFRQRRQILQQVEKLQELDKMKDAFMATVSHELRTPLNAVIGLTDVILDEKLPPAVQQYVRTIHGSGETLLSIINDILDIAKIKSGKLQLESTPFSPYELCESVTTLFAAACEKKGIELSFFAPADLPWITGDPTRLNQILLNLVGNAVKFTEKGEVRLEATWDARPDAKPVLTVRVADTGPGIPREKHELVFEEFAQGDASTTRRYGGTGLGLPIVRRLVQLLGGDVTLADNQPRGSVFTLRLPVSQVVQEPESNTRLPDAILAVAASAVLCGDHPLRTQQLAGLLRRTGLGTTEAADLPAALAELRRCASEGRGSAICVIDRHDVTPEKLRQSGVLSLPRDCLRGVVVALELSAMSQDGPEYRAMRVVGLVPRPVRRTQLREVIEQVILNRPSSGGMQAVQLVPAPKRSRLLVVEDVRENQFLISAFLSKLPVDAVFADNGVQGVELFRKEQFDLVLLDIEMPEMDGYEAVARMRGAEAERELRPTPIIALTAHTSFEHEERARQAGFSHHLSKPIRKRDFEWLLDQFVFAPPDSTPVVRRSSDERLPGVAPEALLLRSSYLHRRQTEIVEMRELLGRRDFKKLGRLGHNLKGSGASYGLQDISTLGRAIEEAAEKNDDAAMRSLLDRLGRSLSKYV